MIVGKLLERTSTFTGPPPPSPPPRGALASTPVDGLLWWSRPADGAFNVIGLGGAGVLSYPGIARGVSLIADTLAGVPRHTYRGDVRVPEPRWIADPGGAFLLPGGVGPGTLTPFDYWSSMYVSAILHGNAYSWIGELDGAGAPRPPLHVLNPAMVTVEAVGDTITAYRVGGEVLDPGEVLHVRGRTLPGTAVGLGVIAQYRETLAELGELRDYARSTFSEGGVPAGILQSTAPDLTQDEASRLKAAWTAAHGTGSRSVAVLNATTSYSPLALPPEDAQFLETRKFGLLEQALMVGVPPSMIGAPSGDSMTYSNVESRMLEFARLSLLPWARRAEDAAERYLPHGTSLRFVLDGLYRADTATRYGAHKTALEGGWLTIDEVRALENLPPLDPSSTSSSSTEEDPSSPELELVPDTEATG